MLSSSLAVTWFMTKALLEIWVYFNILCSSGAKYLVPNIWYQVFFYQVFGTKYFVPSISLGRSEASPRCAKRTARRLQFCVVFLICLCCLLGFEFLFHGFGLISEVLHLCFGVLSYILKFWIYILRSCLIFWGLVLYLWGLGLFFCGFCRSLPRTIFCIEF